MESSYSKNLMYLNSERIKYKQKADYDFFKSNLYYLKFIFKYICLGDFSYVFYRLKEKILRENNKKNIESKKREYKNEKVAVFTVAFGNYDSVKDPMFVNENFDYYIVTNNSDELNFNVWKKYELKEEQLQLIKNFSNLELARFFKLHPDILFSEYKYSIFVDGNVQIVADMIPIIETLGDNFIGLHKQPSRECLYHEATEILAWNKYNKKDVKKQVKQYKREGFPKMFGMFQTNIMVREHNRIDCKELMQCWWDEIEKYTKRDQLSFTYALWKNNLSQNNVSVLGDSSYLNSRFIIDEHIKAKK